MSFNYQKNLAIITAKANEKIKPNHWKVFPGDIKIYGDYVRLFYQATSFVDHKKWDEDNMIYGIGIFLVHLEHHEFHPVRCMEEIEEVAQRLNEGL